MTLILSLAGLGLLSTAQRVNAPFRAGLPAAFGTRGPGTDLDSIAFWEARDPSRTLMFVTAQGNDLVEAWRFGAGGPQLAFQLSGRDSDGCIAGREVNGVVVDQYSDLLYVTISRPSNRVCVFSVSESGARFRRRIETARDLGSEPNLGLLHMRDGRTRIYVSADTVVYPYDVTEIDAVQALAPFTPARGLETIAGDDFHERLYIPDEKGRSGVDVYDPEGKPAAGIERFGAGGVFAADAEGITLYVCHDQDGSDGGAGFIVVSDQRDPVNDYEIFDRRDGRFLGTLRIEGANHTDGIASVQQALPGYPKGVLAVVDDDAAVLGVGWAEILAATHLRCGPA